MHPPRSIPALLGALLLAPSVQAQAFEGTLGMRVREVAGEIKTFVKGGKVRMEMETPMGPGAMIMDPAAGEVYVVMPAQQMYLVMKPADLAQLADSVAQARGAGDGELVATGRKLELAGHACEIHRYVGRESAVDVCLASGLGNLGASAAALFGNPMGGMGSGPAAGRGGAGRAAWLSRLAREDAFPLRVADTTGTVHWEVTRIERQPVDDGLFAVPTGFRRMEMPGFGRRPPAGPRSR